jgi:hypothetical protein
MTEPRLNGFLDGEYVDQQAPPVEVLLAWVRSRRVTDPMLTLADELSRVLLIPDDDRGVSIQLEFADATRLASCRNDFQEPTVLIEAGPHRELWPRDLFLPPGLAEAALTHVLATGAEFPDVIWVNADQFPRLERAAT